MSLFIYTVTCEYIQGCTGLHRFFFCLSIRRPVCSSCVCMVRHRFRLGLALILLVWVNLAGADGDNRGRQIFVEIDQRHNSNYQDFEVGLRMVLTTRRGKQTERQLRIRQLEKADDGDKVMVVFDQPASIRGTALLTHTHLQRPDDQWLFLPALERVKKIASRNKSGAFVGSEFSYEDLTAPEVDKYTYRLLREETCRQQFCAVVERIAKDRFSGYSREIHWVDVEQFRTWKVEYYAKRGDKLFKVLTLDQHRNYAIAEQNPPRLWRPHLMRMENLRTGNQTELRWDNYQFARGFTDDREFSVSSLRRAR